MDKQPGSTGSPAIDVEPPNAGVSATLTVTFLRSNLVVAWDPSTQSLLEFAERRGLSPAFCCRAGVCGTCITTMRRGAVEYFESPVIELERDEVLLCCSRPTESVDIDL